MLHETVVVDVHRSLFGVAENDVVLLLVKQCTDCNLSPGVHKYLNWALPFFDPAIQSVWRRKGNGRAGVKE